MNLREVIEESRILLNEVSHNINTDSEGSFLKDRTILLAVNNCISEIESRLGVKNISYEDVDYNITLIDGQSLYQIPENVNSLKYLVIEKENKRYFPKQVTFEDMMYSYSLKGIPAHYCLDYKLGYIKFDSEINGSDYKLKFIGRVNNSRLKKQDFDKELPFDSKYHMAFIYYVCYFVCRNLIDLDNTQKNRSQDYLEQFNNELLKYKNDIIQNKYSQHGIYFDNGDYNT